MILPMTKVRILGPRKLLPDVLLSLQRFALLHLASSLPAGPLAHNALTSQQAREQRHLLSLSEDLELVLAGFATSTTTGRRPIWAEDAGTAQLARWARLASRLRRDLARLDARDLALREERELILKYQGFFSAFGAILSQEDRWKAATSYHVLLKPGELPAVPRLRSALTALLGDGFELYQRELPQGDSALLIVVPLATADKVERLLAQAGVQEIPVPAEYGGKSLAAAMPIMQARLGEVPRELEAVRREREQLARAHRAELQRAQVAVARRLQSLGAVPLTAVTAHVFALEGWLPADRRKELEGRLQQEVGDAVVVGEISREEWRSEEAPVVLRNPRLLRPFEAVISLLPLPRYGSIDPTPFVAVFFPAFFGLILGDIGYGLILALIGLILHRRSEPGSMLRAVSEMMGPCALFTILAGLLFGELFGDLGHRWFGLTPLAFDRGEALIPFLLLAVGIGTVHVLLGLVLGLISAARGHPRQAIGKGVAAIVVVLVVLILLAAADVLPRSFFTPGVIGLLVAFPVLVLAEGVVAPIELLSTLGNILSYARIMALGVASVMLAVVANRMAGVVGSAVVGVMFALLFHLVNFAIGLFSPTVHALRLHYVEFFGKFYSPGGVRYRPFGAWVGPPEVTRS